MLWMTLVWYGSNGRETRAAFQQCGPNLALNLILLGAEVVRLVIINYNSLHCVAYSPIESMVSMVSVDHRDRLLSDQ